MLTAFLVEARMNEPRTYTSVKYVCFFGAGTNGMYILLHISYPETYHIEKNTPPRKSRGHELWVRMRSTPGPTCSIATVMVLATEMVRVLICPTICSSMISLSDGNYGMPQDTNDEVTPRGFSETSLEGTKLSYTALTCVSSYTVCLSLPQDWFKHYE